MYVRYPIHRTTNITQLLKMPKKNPKNNNEVTACLQYTYSEKIFHTVFSPQNKWRLLNKNHTVKHHDHLWPFLQGSTSLSLKQPLFTLHMALNR